MNRFIFLTALIALLSACSSTAKIPALGSYTHGASVATNKMMASDLATKMSALYPPARSKIVLRHATTDAFGISLADALRKKGYALSEFVKPTPATVPANATAGASDLNLSYVVDQPFDTGTIRITVFINAQSLSRLYQPNESGVVTAGYWVRKE